MKKSKRSKRLRLVDNIIAGKVTVTIKERVCLKKHPLLDLNRPCNMPAAVIGVSVGFKGIYYILQPNNPDKNRYVYHIDDFWIPNS